MGLLDYDFTTLILAKDAGETLSEDEEAALMLHTGRFLCEMGEAMKDFGLNFGDTVSYDLPKRFNKV